MDIPFNSIPNYPIPSVKGHPGILKLCNYNDKDLIISLGRVHYYEGFSMEEITYAVRLFKLLGVERLIVTCSAGAANKKYKPGDFMLIKDHINFLSSNPLIGKNYDAFGVRFPDMTYAYNPELRKIAKNISKRNQMNVREGVYLATTGPSYETPAEILMFRRMGADAVGMSTVPEVIVANHCGIQVLGISVITNMAAGILKKPLSHEEVIEINKNMEKQFVEYLLKILRILI